MTKKLQEICGPVYDIWEDRKGVLKSLPVGKPFVIDIGCPRDTLPIYHWAFGKESLIYPEVLRHSPPGANAYACAERSLEFDDYSPRDPAFPGLRDHRIIAVQLYKLIK